MDDMPSLDAFAKASAVVGLLFALRYLLAMRRLWRDAGHARSFAFTDYFRATRPNAFGVEREPERRYAARQLYFAVFFLLVGLLLFAWLLVAAASSSPTI